MARYAFGGGLADWTLMQGDQVVLGGSTGFYALAVGGATITYWTAETGGTQYTDLIDDGGNPVSSVISSDGTDGRAVGQIPVVSGPDGVTEMWASASGGPRARMVAYRDQTLDVFSKTLVVSPAVTGVFVVWRATRACTVSAVRGYRAGGTGATVNAAINGVDVAAVDLSLSTGSTWMSATADGATVMAVGDTLTVEVVSLAGSPTGVTVQVDLVMA